MRNVNYAHFYDERYSSKVNAACRRPLIEATAIDKQ
jgi:hypothetical protein